MNKINNEMMVPDIYLLRHGETEWNREGRIQGRLNSDLTELGRQQAQAQAAILDDLNLNEADRFCSPLGRTLATADIAYRGKPYTIDERLAEISCGDWEGLTAAERALRDPELSAACITDMDLYSKAPGGEGMAQVQDRVRGFLSDLKNPAIIVSHKVTLIALRGYLTGLPDDQLGELTATQGNVIRISQGVETHLDSTMISANTI